MKYLLLLVVFCTCVYIGVEVKRYFADRLKFYDKMITFCEYAIKEISFYNTTKNKMIEKYTDTCLSAVLCGQNDKLLSDEENRKIQEFLDSIGKFDTTNELQNIQFYKEYLTSQKQKCVVEFDKKGMLSLKLSILIGVLLCILLI